MLQSCKVLKKKLNEQKLNGIYNDKLKLRDFLK